MSPGLVKFIRGACQTVISIGEGVGGALLTVRISGDFADKADSGLRLARMVPSMTQLHGVTAVHVGQLVPDITRVETAETRLRPSASTIEYSFALLVEGIGVNELEATAPDVIGHLKNTVSGTYETRWAKYSRRSLREAVGTRIIGRGLHGFWMDSSHILMRSAHHGFWRLRVCLR